MTFMDCIFCFISLAGIIYWLYFYSDQCQNQEWEGTPNSYRMSQLRRDCSCLETDERIEEQWNFPCEYVTPCTDIVSDPLILRPNSFNLTCMIAAGDRYLFFFIQVVCFVFWAQNNQCFWQRVLKWCMVICQIRICSAYALPKTKQPKVILTT